MKPHMQNSLLCPSEPDLKCLNKTYPNCLEEHGLPVYQDQDRKVIALARRGSKGNTDKLEPMMSLK
jgi:hypothetical protein